MFCCDVFKSLTTSIGNRGFAILACKDSGYRYFCLQSRACEFLEESKLKNIPRDCDPPNPLTILTQIGIQFCPICGTKLETIIAEHPIEFEEFVERCKGFVH